MRLPDIILVNGPSSAGKTTLCRALQARLDEPTLVIGFDDFIFLAAPRYYAGADTARQGPRTGWTAQGVEMVQISPPGAPPAVEARFGPVLRRVIDGMAPAVRALVDAGNRVIFDHVLHDAAMAESCDRAFAGLVVFRLGVTCPVAVLEARERARGDRVLGRARGLAAVVHGFCDYDLTVDTGAAAPEDCVAQVVAALAARSGGVIAGEMDHAIKPAGGIA